MFNCLSSNKHISKIAIKSIVFWKEIRFCLFTVNYFFIFFLRDIQFLKDYYESYHSKSKCCLDAIDIITWWIVQDTTEELIRLRSIAGWFRDASIRSSSGVFRRNKYCLYYFFMFELYQQCQIFCKIF